LTWIQICRMIDMQWDPCISLPLAKPRPYFSLQAFRGKVRCRFATTFLSLISLEKSLKAITWNLKIQFRICSFTRMFCQITGRWARTRNIIWTLVEERLEWWQRNLGLSSNIYECVSWNCRDDYTWRAKMIFRSVVLRCGYMSAPI
jgi:hypothetical protein